MGREINLDGTEITIVKSLGIGSGDVDGKTLMERCRELDLNELMDTLKGLMSVGFVDADSEAFHSEEEFEKVHFRVNSGYAKELREALDPGPQAKPSKRVRRE
jgi:hypothetical protein